MLPCPTAGPSCTLVRKCASQVNLSFTERVCRAVGCQSNQGGYKSVATALGAGQHPCPASSVLLPSLRHTSLGRLCEFAWSRAQLTDNCALCWPCKGGCGVVFVGEVLLSSFSRCFKYVNLEHGWALLGVCELNGVALTDLSAQLYHLG